MLCDYPVFRRKPSSLWSDLGNSLSAAPSSLAEAGRCLWIQWIDNTIAWYFGLSLQQPCIKNLSWSSQHWLQCIGGKAGTVKTTMPWEILKKLQQTAGWQSSMILPAFISNINMSNVILFCAAWSIESWCCEYLNRAASPPARGRCAARTQGGWTHETQSLNHLLFKFSCPWIHILAAGRPL